MFSYLSMFMALATSIQQKVIVDLDVWNCTICAFKPDDQTNPNPNVDAHKILWWNTVDSKRLNNRQFGTLKGKREK
jgi:hypothetical protein